MSRRWYTIQLLPQLRQTAATNLSRQGFEAFFPLLRLRITRKKETIVPLFKGYAFVHLDLDEDRWRSVNGTYGVVGLIPKHLVRPQPNVEGFVERLKEHDPVTETQFDETLAEFHPGADVMVKDSHRWLAKERGVVSKDKGKLLEIIFNLPGGHKSYIMLARDQLEPVEDS